uniref:Uncharacterized protein n=1 Tax=Ditylum brightwellii TaxID=49249 RepID=A0A7S4SGF0_9STRA|mmetsp:Transcript_19871/g.29649  ORF Transcript_19871/g.29649 Transcript_19871/m.29649 type:complete len:146 (+) Transcript_19871:1222-1659(+)
MGSNALGKLYLKACNIRHNAPPVPHNEPKTVNGLRTKDVPSSLSDDNDDKRVVVFFVAKRVLSGVTKGLNLISTIDSDDDDFAVIMTRVKDDVGQNPQAKENRHPVTKRKRMMMEMVIIVFFKIRWIRFNSNNITLTNLSRMDKQ